MPVYQYKCDACQKIFDEFWFSISQAEREEDDFISNSKCPQCGSLQKKRLLIGAPMVSFKGEGWTNTVIVPGTTGRRDSTGALRERSAELKDTAKNLTSKDLYGL
jgi:putative FmdB family regulatory protein